ncbi:MAG: DUF1517 domain-containing protein [Cyanobacteria bacterium P01_G01_bin.49]
MLKKTTKTLLLTIIATAALNTFKFPQTHQLSNNWITIEQKAQARSSGGRSGGGSFSRGSRGSRGSSPPSRGRSHNGSSAYTYPISGSSSSAGGVAINSGFFGIMIFGMSGIAMLAVASGALKNLSGNHQHRYSDSYYGTKDNRKVTISQLQIALLASATDVQSGLSELSLRVDTSTQERLRELLQESIMILLRHCEYWSHGLGKSQEMRINDARSIFEQLSLKQRSKLTQETLSNVGGQIQEKTVITSEDESAMYIVVTLLIGTAHEQAQFKELRTVEDFQEALQQMASTAPDDLLKLELLWSPQAKNDSLTYDEFITEYTEMRPFV